jgi:hypothetical protein
MRSMRSSWRTAETGRGAPPAAGDFHSFREVVGEIGLLLAIHLAAAFAVGLTLRLFGIA